MGGLVVVEKVIRSLISLLHGTGSSAIFPAEIAPSYRVSTASDPPLEV